MDVDELKLFLAEIRSDNESCSGAENENSEDDYIHVDPMDIDELPVIEQNAESLYSEADDLRLKQLIPYTSSAWHKNPVSACSRSHKLQALAIY